MRFSPITKNWRSNVAFFSIGAIHFLMQWLPDISLFDLTKSSTHLRFRCRHSITGWTTSGISTSFYSLWMTLRKCQSASKMWSGQWVILGAFAPHCSRVNNRLLWTWQAIGLLLLVRCSCNSPRGAQETNRIMIARRFQRLPRPLRDSATRWD